VRRIIKNMQQVNSVI